MANDDPTPTDPTPAVPPAAGTPPAPAPVGVFRDSPEAEAAAAAAKPKPRRRRWLKVAGVVAAVLLVGLLLIVALVPKIASTGMVRSMVVGQINKNLAGKVEIADWSFSWTGGLRVTGVKVFDDQSRQVAQIDSLATQLKLTDAIRGNLALGTSTVAGLDVTYTEYPDGTTTLDHVLRKAAVQPQAPQPQPPQPNPPKPAETPKPAEPARPPEPAQPPAPAEKPELPKLSGQFALQQARVTYVRNTGDPRTSHVAKLGVDGVVNVPDLQTAPIDDKLTVQAAVDNGGPATLAVAGKAAVAANGKLDLDAANVDQVVTLAAVDAAAVRAFLPPAAVRELAGRYDGSLTLKVADGKAATVSGSLTGTGVAVATAAFAPGEAFRAKRLAVTIPPTVLSAPQGLTKYEAGTLKIGDGSKDQISVKADDLLALTLSADAPVAALQAAAGNERPAAGGTVHQAFNADLAALAKVMPATLGLKPGVAVDAGRVEQSVTLTTTPGKWQPRVELRVVDLKGSAEAVDEKGTTTRKPIAVAPIGVEMKLDAYGGGWKTPDLRDLALGVRSGFLNGDVTAKTLADLNGKIAGDLARAKQQFGQFVALDAYDVQGTVELAAAAKGDPTKPEAPTELTVSAVVHDLRLAGPAMGAKPVVQPLAQVSLRTTVLRNPAGDVIGLPRTTVTARTGVETAPTVDVEAVAEELKVVAATDAKKSNGRVDVPRFTITKGTIALPKLQAELGALLPLPPDLTVANGTAQLTGGGSLVNDKLMADVKLVAADVGLTRTVALAESGPAAAVRQPVEVLKAYTLTADLGVARATDAAGTATTTVTKLSVADNQNLLTLAKTDAPLTLTQPKGVPASVAGSMRFGLDLGRANAIAERLGATAAQLIASASGQSNDPTLKAGRLDGSATLTPAADGGLAVAVDADASGLTVAASAPAAVPVLKDERLRLTARLAAAAEFAAVDLQQFEATGSLVTAKASGRFQLKDGRGADARPVPPLAMLRKLNVVATAPDLKRAQTLIDAVWPGAKPAAATVAYGPFPDGRGAPEVLAANGAPVQLAAADKRSAVRAAAGAAPSPAAAPTPPATQPAAVPPTKLAGGSATLTLDVTGDGTTLTTAVDVQAKAVVLAVGTATHPVGDVTAKSNVAVLSHPAAPVAPAVKSGPAAAPPSVMEQIAELRVSALNVAGLGTTVTLKQPVVVKGLADLPTLFGTPATPATRPAGGGGAAVAVAAPAAAAGKPAEASKASLAGAFHVAGQLDPLMQVKAFMAGQPAKADYGGAFTLDQALATDGGVIKVEGGGLVSDFVARDPAGKQTFAEKAVRLANSLALDTKGVGTLTIGRLGLAFEASQALNVEANGQISDFAKSRAIQGILANVAYDAEKLWLIVRPMMADPSVPPEKDPYKDWMVKGRATRSFTVGGSFPAVDAAGNPVPFNVAVQQLAVNGGLGLDWFSGEGLQVGRQPASGQAPSAPGQLMPVEIPFSLVSGYLHLADLRKPAGQQTPAPIPCNGGTINPFGAYVNLTGTTPTLTMPKGLALLSKVQLNSVLADKLGEYFNHPLLVGADTAKGVLDLTVEECRDVPMGQAAKLRTPDNRGYAKLVMSFGGIQLGNPTLVSVLSALKVNANSLQGEMRNATVTYDRGVIGHDTTFALAEQGRTLRLYGDVNLATEKMAPMALLISPEWFGKDVARYVPKGLPLAFTGSYRAPRYDFGAAVQEAVKQNFIPGGGKNPAEAIGNIGDLIKGVQGKGGDGKKKPGGGGAAADGAGAANPGGSAATTQPAAKPQDDPLGLIGDLLKERERKDKEKKEKERRGKEKRDRE